MSQFSPKVTFNKPQSSKKGVYLHIADFQAKNKSINPFKGGKFIVQPMKTSNLDEHQVQECWMVAKGSGILSYENRKVEIFEGDFLFYTPLKKHQVFNSSKSEDLIIYTVWW